MYIFEYKTQYTFVRGTILVHNFRSTLGRRYFFTVFFFDIFFERVFVGICDILVHTLEILIIIITTSVH